MRIQRNFFAILTILFMFTGIIWTAALGVAVVSLYEKPEPEWRAKPDGSRWLDEGEPLEDVLAKYIGYSWAFFGPAILICFFFWQRNDIGYRRELHHQEQMAEMRKLRAAMEGNPNLSDTKPYLPAPAAPAPLPNTRIRYEEPRQIIVDPHSHHRYDPEPMVEPPSTSPDPRYAPRKVRKIKR